MRIAIIGRTEILYDTACLLKRSGYEISCILTAKEAPEYTRRAQDFQYLAENWDVPFAQGPRILEYFEFLKASRSDIAVSVNYPGVLPSEVIEVFPLGVLNAHGGDLPRYRGNACQAWAILSGETRIALCVHKMVGGEIDSGDIIARDYFAINSSTKVTQTWNWLVERSPELILEAVRHLANDSNYVLERQSKDPKDALRCYPLRPEDGRISWDKKASDVLKLVNAFNRPYAGAFCRYQSRHLVVWDACVSATSDERFLAVPGQVTCIGDGFVDVACRYGKVRLLEVEIDGVLTRPDKIITSVRARLL